MKMELHLLLPLEITAEILSRLPADSIVECKCVCKTWRTLIEKDPLFIFAYHNNTAQRQSSPIPNSITTTTELEEEEAQQQQQPFGFLILSATQQLQYGEYYYKKKKEEEETDHHIKVVKCSSIKFPPLPPPPPHPYPFYNYNYNYMEEKKVIWEILGSSNGLICLSANRLEAIDVFKYYIYVYNPMTKEFAEVGTETCRDKWSRASGFGFGYLPSTNEYKLVRISYQINLDSIWLSGPGHVKVYTLGSGSGAWRDKGEIPYEILLIRFPSKPGVLVNGAIHWITKDEKNILAFDLTDEEFRIVPIVPKPWQVRRYDIGLGVLRGRLSVAAVVPSEYGNTTTQNNNVWVMNNTPNQSWVKFPRVFYKSSPKYFSDWLFNEISSYGLKYEGFCRFCHYMKSLHFGSDFVIIPYTKSFVSLKALGEENVKKIC